MSCECHFILTIRAVNASFGRFHMHERNERLRLEYLQWNMRAMCFWKWVFYGADRLRFTASGSRMSFLQSERGGGGEREGLGPARKASESGLALGPVTAWGPADPGLLFLSQNNNPLLSKAPTKGPVPTSVGGSPRVAGLGRGLYFWWSHLFWVPVIWGKCQRGWDGWQCLGELRLTRF